MALMNDPEIWFKYYFPQYTEGRGGGKTANAIWMDEASELFPDTIDIDYEEIKPLELPEAKIPGQSPGH